MNTQHTVKLAAAAIGTMLIVSVPIVSNASEQGAWVHPVPDGYPAAHYNYRSAKGATPADRGANDAMSNQSEFRHAPPDGYPAAHYGYSANSTTTPAKLGDADQQEFRHLPPDGYPAAHYGYKADPAPAAKLSLQK